MEKRKIINEVRIMNEWRRALFANLTSGVLHHCLGIRINSVNDRPGSTATSNPASAFPFENISDNSLLNETQLLSCISYYQSITDTNNESFNRCT